MKPTPAFSLVELSIVLVILGLLTGGILAGKSLIRASGLRAVTAEYNRYLTAEQAFRDKYFAIPGDFTIATSVWSQSTTCGGGTANGVCNGDGDGTITTNSNEPFQFWSHLAAAGLVEGTYSGIHGAGGTSDHIIGTNCPPSKLDNAGWSVETRGTVPPGSGGVVRYSGNYGNDLVFGGQQTGSNTNYPSALKPEEAWNIDTKLDDGMPGTGKVIVRSFIAWGASSCSTSANDSDFTGVYNVSYTAQQCALYFARAF